MAITIKEIHVRTTVVRSAPKTEAVPDELMRRIRRTILEELRAAMLARVRDEKER